MIRHGALALVYAVYMCICWAHKQQKAALQMALQLAQSTAAKASSPMFAEPDAYAHRLPIVLDFQQALSVALALLQDSPCS